MRFQLIDAAKKEFPVQRLCKVLEVQPKRLPSPGRAAPPLGGSATTSCCSPMFARPLRSPTGPTAARA